MKFTAFAYTCVSTLLAGNLMLRALPQPVEEAPNSFSVSGANRGDEVAEWRIDGVNIVLREDARELPDVHVTFVGTAHLDGLYLPARQGAPPCFIPDIGSDLRIPRIDIDFREPRFCFSNATNAANTLGDLPREARVNISDFTINMTDDETAHDVARLDSVVWAGPGTEDLRPDDEDEEGILGEPPPVAPGIAERITL